jgi:hypothetical protein
LHRVSDSEYTFRTEPVTGVRRERGHDDRRAELHDRDDAGLAHAATFEGEHENRQPRRVFGECESGEPELQAPQLGIPRHFPHDPGPATHIAHGDTARDRDAL